MKHHLRYSGIIHLVLAGAAGLLLSGCMGTITPKAITPDRVAVARQHTGSVTVKAAVLQHHSKTEETILPPETLAEGIRNAIRDAGLFSSVKNGGADFVLDVRITGAESHGGFTVGHKLRSTWQVVRTSDQKVVFTDFVEAEGEASVGDALNGFKRVRIAAERVTKNLIEEGVARLGRANLE